MYVCSQYNYYTPPFVIAVFLCPIIPCQIHKSEGLCEESKIGIFYLKFFFLGRVQTWCTYVTTVCQQTEKWKTECDNYTEPRWKKKKEKVYFRKNKRYFKNLKSGWHGFLPIIPLTTQVNIDILLYILNGTMYDFHNATDTLKFWTEKRAINKTFLFFIRFWWNLVKL